MSYYNVHEDIQEEDEEFCNNAMQLTNVNSTASAALNINRETFSFHCLESGSSENCTLQGAFFLERNFSNWIHTCIVTCSYFLMNSLCTC